MGTRIPPELRYTREHLWVGQGERGLRVGITDFAQSEFGDVLYVELPRLDRVVAPSAPFGSVESAKAVTELSPPIAGSIVAVNAALRAEPELINRDPYGAGWLCELGPSDARELQALLDADGYLAWVREIAPEESD